MITQGQDLIGLDNEGFIFAMAPYIDLVRAKGYPASLFFAQSALESSWGQSVLAPMNNLWGHKFKPETDEGVYEQFWKATPEERDGQIVSEFHPFRVYRNLEQGTLAWCAKWEECWLSGKRKYPDIDRTNGRTFLHSVAHIYATDSRYEEKILRLFDEYHLDLLDMKGVEDSDTER